MPLERLTRKRIVDAFDALTPEARKLIRELNLVLEEPWFSEEFQGVWPMLLRDSPSAFKDKNLFVFESALSVA